MDTYSACKNEGLASYRAQVQLERHVLLPLRSSASASPRCRKGLVASPTPLHISCTPAPKLLPIWQGAQITRLSYPSAQHPLQVSHTSPATCALPGTICSGGIAAVGSTRGAPREIRQRSPRFDPLPYPACQSNVVCQVRV